MADYNSIPRWEDVKHDPVERYHYHKQWFDAILEDVEQMTRNLRELAKEHKPCSDFTIDVLRLQLDGMVKCMSQFYCDVNQGFPGFDSAIWPSSDCTILNMSKKEVAWMRDAIEYANEQVGTSNGEINPYWLIDCQTDPDKQKEISETMQKVSSSIKTALMQGQIMIVSK